MNFLEAVLSGIIQGLTEFLPISSSGHLVILHNLFGLKEPQILFDIFLHLGTLLAIVIVFARDIVDLFTIRKRNIIHLLIATLVTGVFVVIFGKGIERVFSDVKLVGVMLVLTGVWLFVGVFVRFGGETLSGIKSVIVGISQGIAAIPGISRSGATISTAMFLGLSPNSAVRFSFLLSIPAIVGAFILKVKQGGLEGFSINYIFGFITSCIVGIFSLRLLLKVLYKNKLYIFGFYCIIAGMLVLIFL
ncbi:MAG: undecaprenyl-diphosphate phosphatase [Candidatus Omnitrophota bacterium]